MHVWTERLLGKIHPEHRRLQIAHDPDGLLLDEISLGVLAIRGYTILSWQDEVSFRLDYETRFRAIWDRHQEAETPAVLLHFDGDTLDDLPWDIVQAAFVHRLSLSELFSGLAMSVVRAIPAAHLAVLYQRTIAKRPGAMGENATADFVLLNVFKIADALIDTDADLLRLLLDLHFRQVVLPDVLVQRLAGLLADYAQFKDWPLQLLIGERLEFLTFIEERWPLAVERALVANSPPEACESSPPPYAMRIAGPAQLPFSDNSVRVILDNFFLEGVLPRLAMTRDISHLPQWMQAGIAVDDAAAQQRRMDQLLSLLTEKLPLHDARHNDWVQCGWRWAEAVRSWHQLTLKQQKPLAEHYAAVQQAIDSGFADWLSIRYGPLALAASVTAPVMGHHVAPFLARRVAAGAKVALIVMDGMAMDQWLLLQHDMDQRGLDIEVDRGGLFAWAPTLTSIARQAIFAGALPRHLKNLASTQGEPTAWATFWDSHGLGQQAVKYIKGIARLDQLPEIEELASGSQVRAIGIVVDAIDEMMHGITQGTRGLHSQVTTWAEYRLMDRLFRSLSAQGFDIYVTSDHGNVEARGNGRISQGSLAETRGERVRIYGDRVLMEKTATDIGQRGFPGTTAGLPDAMYPLYASGRTGFVPASEVIVAHGGMCIEELIVPFVRVKRKTPTL
jgi:hypothetical protein